MQKSFTTFASGSVEIKGDGVVWKLDESIPGQGCIPSLLLNHHLCVLLAIISSQLHHCSPQFNGSPHLVASFLRSHKNDGWPIRVPDFPRRPKWESVEQKKVTVPPSCSRHPLSVNVKHEDVLTIKALSSTKSCLNLSKLCDHSHRAM